MSFRTLKGFDWPLFAATILLSLAGLVMIYGLGLGGATREQDLWSRQLLALGLGIAGLFFFASLDYHFFQKNSLFFYFLALGLLVLVLLFGQEIRGSTRWFNLGLFNFQPAEFSKFALILLLASFFQAKRPYLKKFSYVLASAVAVGLPIFLIIVQPDLGSALIHLLIWLGLLILASIPRRFFVYLLVLCLVLAGLAWQFLFQDYQRDRLQSFLDPYADPLGRGYNVIQAVVAVGAGGIFGRGLGRGVQSQLNFLPEQQTDFIFASAIEELGLVGGSLLLGLLFFVAYRILKILHATRDWFGIFLGGGIFFLFVAQSLINIAMNLGLLPITGITLPLISYGGSSLVISLWLLGIMQSLAKSTKSF